METAISILKAKKINILKDINANCNTSLRAVNIVSEQIDNAIRILERELN